MASCSNIIVFSSIKLEYSEATGPLGFRIYPVSLSHTYPNGIHADVSKPDDYDASLLCMTSPSTSPDAKVKDIIPSFSSENLNSHSK